MFTFSESSLSSSMPYPYRSASDSSQLVLLCLSVSNYHCDEHSDLDCFAGNGGPAKSVARPKALSQDETTGWCNEVYRFASVLWR